MKNCVIITEEFTLDYDKFPPINNRTEMLNHFSESGCGIFEHVQGLRSRWVWFDEKDNKTMGAVYNFYTRGDYEAWKKSSAKEEFDSRLFISHGTMKRHEYFEVMEGSEKTQNMCPWVHSDDQSRVNKNDLLNAQMLIETIELDKNAG